MNFTEFTDLIAGLLQFVVAGYALRLNRLFGARRVGWSLFSAFALLALLHVMQFAIPAGGIASGVKVEVLYTLISLLLLTGMIHLESVLKERERVERAELRMRTQLEMEVQIKTGHLFRAIEELEAETDQRKRMETVVETTHQELRAVSRQAELAQIAASVMQNIGQMIKSVNVSANLVSNQVKQSKIANVVNVGALIRDHAEDWGKFLARDPRGQKLPVYITQLAEHLAAEQTNLLQELGSLNEHLQKIAAMQQDYAKLAVVADTPTTDGMADETQKMEAMVAI